MSIFHSGSVEIISLILQSCPTFRDIAAVTASCQHVQSIWQQNKDHIILQVRRNIVLSFDEALIVVRSTKIVKDAYEAGVLPPKINLDSLSAEAKKPTIDDIISILNLRHLAHYFELKFLRRSRTAQSWGYGARHLLDDSLELLPIFRQNFHRALYRFFIMGAVLSRDYLEPHFDGKTKNPLSFLLMLRDLLELRTSGDSDHWIRDMPMEQHEVRHFCRYPIYIFWPHPGWEDCFGGFSRWLVTKTQNRLQNELPVSPGSDDSSYAFDGEVLREIMQLLVMYGQMTDMKDGLLPLNQEPFWIRHSLNDNDVCICHPDPLIEEEEEDQEPPTSLDSDYKVDVIFSRAWEPRTTYVRVTLSESEPGDEPDFFYRKIKRGPTAPEMCDILDVVEILHCFSERPNRVSGYAAPHPPLHLFTFILKKYFGYRFDDLAFEVNYFEPIYRNFIQNGRIFTQDGEWPGMLTSADNKEITTNRNLSWADNPALSNNYDESEASDGLDQDEDDDKGE